VRGEDDFLRSFQEWGSLNQALVDKRGQDVFGLVAISQTLFFGNWSFQGFLITLGMAVPTWFRLKTRTTDQSHDNI
jgi:hypothetical protein